MTQVPGHWPVSQFQMEPVQYSSFATETTASVTEQRGRNSAKCWDAMLVWNGSLLQNKDAPLPEAHAASSLKAALNFKGTDT